MANRSGVNFDPYVTNINLTVSNRPSFSQVSFRDMMHRARKEAILEECTRLLSERGYDAMTLDQVAEAAGMAKAMLYKHFKGKEDLCCEVMVRGLERAQGFLDGLPARMVASQRLQAFVRWVLQAQLNSDAPLLAERKSEIRHALKASEPYQLALQGLSTRLEEWIVQAQEAGHIHPGWPLLVARQMLMTRAVDPMVDALMHTQAYSHDEVVEWCVKTCMATLHASPEYLPLSQKAKPAKKSMLAVG